ncbi:MAG: hypothetical protein Ct9H300mP6_13250 [Gammaproteobacteria bacterium]|nr:MAG: hypothetical protein Ct9H300mP6_13250 [Gammaproteobacteria bacterium]
MFTGILQIGFPLGWFFASILVVFMIDNLGINWRYTFLLAFLFVPYGWVIHKYLPESKVWLEAQNKKTENQPKASTLVLFQKSTERNRSSYFQANFFTLLPMGAR